MAPATGNQLPGRAYFFEGKILHILMIISFREMQNIFNNLLSVLCLADLLVILTTVVASARALLLQGTGKITCV